ncbi:hypothetical protein [Streptomyces sp. NPDC004763]
MIRRYCATAQSVWRPLTSFFLIFFISLLMVRSYIELVDIILRVADHPPFGLKSGDFTITALWDAASSSNLIRFATLIALALTVLFLALTWLLGICLIASKLIRMQWDRLRGAPSNRYRVAAETANAIRLCELAYRRAPGSVAQQQALRTLASSLHIVYSVILRLSETSAPVHPQSKRMGQLRKHHLKVIAVLQEKEEALDVDARTALPDLAETLARITNTFSEGKIGQLLPDSEVAHVTPVAPVKREHVRMIAVAVLLGGCGVLVAFLDLPDTATTSLIGAIGITIVSMVYGHQARKGLELSDSLRGIQRPG